jgi:hypothetical protein
MSALGNGLADARYHADALPVKEAELSMERRLGTSEHDLLVLQTNLAITYEALGRPEAMQIKRDVYNGYLKVHGEEHLNTLMAANNHAVSLIDDQRFKEARSLLRKTMPVARRVIGERHELMLRMRWNYGMALYKDPDATLDDLREAVETYEDTERIARRVFGGANPMTIGIERALQESRTVLHARETPSSA